MKYVYHGSEYMHTSSVPTRNCRITNGNVMFDKMSFHATPHKWIAVAYTYTPKEYTVNGKKYHYNIGVNLKKYSKDLYICGTQSLEHSLKQLYGNGGYITKFRAENFYWQEGLGSEEVIIEKEINCEESEFIEDPVSFLNQNGIKFHFKEIA